MRRAKKAARLEKQRTERERERSGERSGESMGESELRDNYIHVWHAR
jgi:hypothetical protein